jgi:hypothetical protein
MFGSLTAWFPVVDPISVSKEIAIPSQMHVEGIVSVVANLSAPQNALFFSQTTPFAFLPHIGLFVSEFAVGTALGK